MASSIKLIENEFDGLDADPVKITIFKLQLIEMARQATKILYFFYENFFNPRKKVFRYGSSIRRVSVKMVCCCTPGCIRCFLIFFNILLAIAGGALVFIGAVIQWNIYAFSEFLTGIISAPGIILMVVGVALVIVAIIGFCGAVTGSGWVYIISLCIIIALELAGGVFALTLQDEIDAAIMKAMKELMPLYTNTGPEGQVAKEAWNAIQKSFKCCGVESPQDWLQVPGLETPPDSCSCNPITGSSCSIDGIYEKGCYTLVSGWFRLVETVLGTLAIGFAIVQLISAIFVCVCKGMCKCCC
ncbi:23 kDa integral membrane protein-like [Neocloeon triangulifer]|uniref:23 kDa integral membrane protein-like n=1 Tax=Neocloeon triangulifer TaxID=2078957 RepID=UPI00286F8143|nr:23 kDa integral membrane protein-like [Neocloeon triangulifer]